MEHKLEVDGEFDVRINGLRVLTGGGQLGSNSRSYADHMRCVVEEYYRDLAIPRRAVEVTSHEITERHDGGSPGTTHRFWLDCDLGAFLSDCGISGWCPICDKCGEPAPSVTAGCTPGVALCCTDSSSEIGG